MTSEVAAEAAADAQFDRDAAACLFRSFGDPRRLEIVAHLLLGEHRVAELTEHLGLAQSTVSAHVACLRECGLLTSRVEGRSTYYALAEPALTKALLSAAAGLLAGSAWAITSCPTNGLPR